MKKYRILHIEYRDLYNPEAGGAEVILFEIFKRLIQQGHQVDFLCHRYENKPDRDNIDGVNIIRIGNKFSFNYIVPFFVRRWLKSNSYDLILEGINKLPFFTPLFIRAPIGAVIPHLFGTTVYTEVNWFFATYVYLFEQPIPYVYRNCRFTVLSQSTKADLISRGIKENLIEINYPGLDLDYYRPPSAPLNKTHKVLTYLGRIKKYKGIDMGIYAIERLRQKYPDIRYYIIGQGDYTEPLKKIVQEKHLEEYVIFYGHQSGANKIRLLHETDILLYTSEKEGWGMSAIEANACGIPVIASNSPGLSEAVIDGQTGFLIEHGNLGQLTDRINQIFQSVELRDKLRIGAIEWSNKFHWDKAADEFLEFMERTIAHYKNQ